MQNERKKILFRLNVKCQSNVRLKAITNLFIYAIVIESKVDTKYSTRIKLKKKNTKKFVDLNAAVRMFGGQTDLKTNESENG